MLSLKNLTVSIEKKKILKGINFTFKKGSVYAVMGPNGSGKSTLASTIMGHPAYTVSKNSKIKYQNKDITELDPDKRAHMGLFMSFQSPLSLSGVTIYQLMRYSLSGRMDPVKIRERVNSYAKKLNISDDLLSRSLNEGFSGGEKKKMEVLQAAVLEPEVLIFDEIDTGVDVDALRSIARFMNTMKSSGKTFIIITHYNRILKYLRPDAVLILVNGKLVKTGTAKLADTIEKGGYDKLKL